MGMLAGARCKADADPGHLRMRVLASLSSQTNAEAQSSKIDQHECEDGRSESESMSVRAE